MMKTILIANSKGGCGKTTVAVTLAGALARGGWTVALADADPQKSARRWLKRRPSNVRPITQVDWTGARSIGSAPKGLDWLIVDAPGAQDEAALKTLVSESHAVIVPVLPSTFDAEATKRFLKMLGGIKRVRKGKAEALLVANRLRPRQRSSARLAAFFDKMGQAPVTHVTERAAYGDLADEGLTIFDRDLAALRPIQDQWAPLVDAL
ncbi:ParA family protein [Tropicimonas sp. IMCC34011]|uniref:ParA family protein n=1 Tax=Tropicimonas sp. IMCC34011 TaxID=2248759 RepID=UPI0018E51E95|nr:ParA family protein [Tropicimonas sp. IMCC34011]